MSLDVATIVPANRLGQLLVEARQRQGADLQALSARSEFTVGELSDIEAGHRILDESLVGTITSLYEIDFGPIIPQRAELVIDLDDKLLTASGQALSLESGNQDHILERYLSLVYVLRNRPPGTQVPLRTEDIDILAASLAERAELIEEQLLISMDAGHEPVRGLVAWLRKRLWVPGAGALVGAVSIGTLVMVAGDAEVPEPTDVPEPEPDPTPDALRSSAASFSNRIGVGQDETIQPFVAQDPAGKELTSPSGEAASPSELAQPTTSTSTSQPATTVAPTTVAPTTAAPTTAAPTTAAPTTAPASVALADPTSSLSRPEVIGAQAEALLPFSWRQILPDWDVVYLESDPQFRGLTYPYDQSIELFVRDDDTPESLAGILAHELAHAIDVQYLDDGDRNEWAEARRIEDASWWPDAFARDFQTGAGDFAESFAFWALGDPSSSELGGAPNAEQRALIEKFLADR